MKTLEITTKVGCKNMCWYCPQDKLLDNYKGNTDLSFDSFKKILSNVPKNVKIEFSGFSEAFLNRESSFMMKYAIQKKYLVELFTTIVGVTKEDVQHLKDCLFERIWFHQFDGQNEDEFNEKINWFKSKIKAKNYALTIVDKKYNNVLTRAGNLSDVKEQLGPLTCKSTADFDHNVVLPNGDVYLCCMDWSLKHKIGNLFETHFDKLNRESIKILALQYKSNIICRKCELFDPIFKLPFEIKI